MNDTFYKNYQQIEQIVTLYYTIKEKNNSKWLYKSLTSQLNKLLDKEFLLVFPPKTLFKVISNFSARLWEICLFEGSIRCDQRFIVT